MRTLSLRRLRPVKERRSPRVSALGRHLNVPSTPQLFQGPEPDVARDQRAASEPLQVRILVLSSVPGKEPTPVRDSTARLAVAVYDWAAVNG